MPSLTKTSVYRAQAWPTRVSAGQVATLFQTTVTIEPCERELKP